MAPFQAVFLPEERLCWVYLLSAVLIAGWARGKLKRFRWSKIKLYFFSWKTSALLDYRFFIVNRVLFGLCFSPLFLALNVWVSSACEIYLHQYLPLLQGIAAVHFGIRNGWNDLALTLFSLIAMDVAFFLSHRLQHRVPALWAFHKVHHSAQVLTPLTAYRVHPVDDILSLTLSALLVGGVEGIFAFITSHSSHVLTLAGVQIGLVIFYMAGFNLRHSRAWMSYGTFWSHWFISPAQHHIHHSVKPEHFDKNFGFIFACWDRCCGSLLIPSKAQHLRVGLTTTTDDVNFDSVWGLYCHPFIALWHGSRSRFVGLLIAVLMAEIIWINASAAYQALSARSVFLEDLSSPEVKTLISAGYDTLLIPTGGLEQNGNHMALGKHNSVLRYTSQHIALQLGHTLVAPLIPIVPEGQFHPATGHLQWPGTLGLSSGVFEGVLLDIAQSAELHGFRYVCFIGEHGESQVSQMRVAQKINQDQTRFSHRFSALNVDAYYEDAEQRSWLLSRGETEQTIGHHGGIIDTSELMAVEPGRVGLQVVSKIRAVGNLEAIPYRAPAAPGAPAQSHFDLLGGELKEGSDGQPSRASASYGQVLINLKIKHAVTQIQNWKSHIS
jgi:sterol desaturase/sphingolipid hydroxylase (fatty acid hydroxylase superfamily)/creatinine amidohydrolase/Fe(II)-dependent formamide hydrolase-like protein